MTVLESIGNTGNAILEFVASIEYSRHAQTFVGGVANTAEAVATSAYVALESVSLSVSESQPTSDVYSIGLAVVLLATAAYLYRGSHKAAAIAGVILGVSAGVIAGSLTVGITVGITVGLGAVVIERVAERALDYLVQRRFREPLTNLNGTIAAQEVTIEGMRAQIEGLESQVASDEEVEEGPVTLMGRVRNVAASFFNRINPFGGVSSASNQRHQAFLQWRKDNQPTEVLDLDADDAPSDDAGNAGIC